ncbi:Putative fructokinase [Mobiluncus mulieris]|uniref:ROK family protein n=1 Tax=Mobiluncus mulieris TaxID=2052 RepID=UPI00019F870A|nr:ROK family protein [Mobiluncus mulieris]EEJ54908.1 ROK family protein [Mobiluncus mulieris ATCC 35243]SPX70134.1 Putative fructokinase [Mobiluncus mulieris]
MSTDTSPAGGAGGAATVGTAASRGANPNEPTPPRYALAFDVGGTNIKMALVAPNASLVELPSVKTTQGGAEALVAQLSEEYDRIQAQLAEGTILTPSTETLTSENICKAVGVAIPGLVDESTGMTIKSANLGWGRFPMRDTLAQALGTPVLLGHDLRSGALGEARFTGRRDCIFVAIGTGIAAGIVLDGQVLNRGATSGEIGQVLFPNPDRQYLSESENLGSHLMNPPEMLPLEQLASAAFTGRRYAALAGLDTPPGSKAVFAREREGDAAAHHVVETGTAALAQALAAMIATLGDLEVIIGGGQSKEGPAYLERLRAATTARLVNLPEPRFSLARFGSRAQLLGAAARVFDYEGIATQVVADCDTVKSANAAATPAGTS